MVHSSYTYMKNTLLFVFVISQFTLSAQIISEIMFDPPESGVDSLEYLEIYNNTGADLDLQGYSMIGVTHTFAEPTPLATEQYMVISINPTALTNNFGVTSMQWDDGALNNGGEDIGIINAEGDTIFWMEYSSSGPWPSNRYGAAMELCDLESDYTLATNWNLAQERGNSMINNLFPFGSPGSANDAVCQQRDYKDLVINEILYEQPAWDPDLQYVEFYNHGDKTINLAGWSISGSINLPFFSNTHIGPGEYLMMTNAFQSLVPFLQPPPSSIIIFNLSIIGEPNFVLTNPNGDEVMDFQYGVGIEFPIAQRGEAVELCDPTDDPNDGMNWAISSNTLTDDDGNTFLGTPLIINNCEPSNTLDLSDELSSAFRIVPQPVETAFRIESEEAYDAVQLIDKYGRVLVERPAGIEIRIDDFPSGTYALRIFTPNGFVTKKLTKL